MITKEQFLKNTDNDEIFSLIGEFLNLYEEQFNRPNLNKDDWVKCSPMDKEIFNIIKQMVKDVKKSNYL